MPQTLLRGTGISLAEQVRVQLLHSIESGDLLPGEKLPTEKELAAHFGISLAPVRAALASLAASGHVRRIQGRGTFVAEEPVSIQVGLFPSLTQVLNEQGVSFTLTGVFTTVAPTPDVAAPWFDRSPEEVVWLRRTVLVRSRPVAALDAWLPAPRFARLTEVDFTSGRSLYAAMGELYGLSPVNKDGTLSVMAATPVIGSALELAIGAPVIQVMRSASTVEEPDQVVEVSRTYYDPTVFSFRLKP